MSRVACETLVTTGLAIVAGEITTTAVIDYQEVVRATIREIGYDRGKYGYDAETCAVLSSIHSQSPDIAMGVDTGGAGDQGLMFGFACTETAGADAAADHAGAQAGEGAVVPAARRDAEVSAAGRQVAGDGGLRGHHAGAGGRGGGVEPAQPGRDAGADAGRRDREDREAARFRRR